MSEMSLFLFFQEQLQHEYKGALVAWCSYEPAEWVGALLCCLSYISVGLMWKQKLHKVTEQGEIHEKPTSVHEVLNGLWVEVREPHTVRLLVWLPAFPGSIWHLLFSLKDIMKLKYLFIGVSLRSRGYCSIFIWQKYVRKFIISKCDSCPIKFHNIFRIYLALGVLKWHMNLFCFGQSSLRYLLHMNIGHAFSWKKADSCEENFLNEDFNPGPSV